MAQGDTPITIVGNVVADPELRFTQGGAAVANFRVASTPRRFNSQTNQWEDGEALFLTCNVWRQAAENVAESLKKGMRVIVTGKLRQRSWDDRDGNKRTVFEVEVDEVGPSLKFASAQVNRNPREGGSGNYGGGNYGGGNSGGGNNYGGGNSGGYQNNFGGGNSGGGNNYGGFGGNQFQGGQQSHQPPQDPWNSAPEAGSAPDGIDNPPF
ncbi:single-stranded DNA-binding protein [Corynebacterium uterequi]|uniref:Single-stranded DNA-binding protein n=1 Tax=Corynebacterium uterequi TaxID=1072256 RepID=A0A0G3HFP3_9CORY|nr:single-stranded DNA-binding protein [Corynebacterium uterequi]AKK12131.1 single-strand binding protein [Corynebacterium uterequi]